MTQAARRPLIAGNWKMVKTRAEATAFIEALAPHLLTLPSHNLPELMLCPNFLALVPLTEAIERLSLPITVAAQTMESREEGAFTGEVSPLMLEEAGIRAVLLGHSERRQYYNETDASVHNKVEAALKHTLTPIVCVGETMEEREAGQTDAVIARQVKAAIHSLSPEQLENLIFAYEPVWAIGTGKVCDAAEAERVCGLIRTLLAECSPEVATHVRILYGGSMNPDNATSLLSQPNIDGGLVGGASLKPEGYLALVQAAMKSLVLS